MYLMYVLMGKAFYRGVKGPGLEYIFSVCVLWPYPSAFFIIIFFFMLVFKVPKAVRMMSLSHTQSPSSNMLHEKSVKCSSKVNFLNDFTSPRVRGNKNSAKGGGGGGGGRAGEIALIVTPSHP